MFMKSSLKLLYFSKLANIHIYLLYILYNSIQIFYRKIHNIINNTFRILLKI